MDDTSYKNAGSALAWLVLLGVFYCPAASSHASGKPVSGKVVFGGVVTKPEQPDPVQTYPRNVVSFGSRAVLPIDPHYAGSGDVSVYNARGEKVSGSATVLITKGSKQRSVQLVDLDDTREQVFVVCSGNKTNCMRFHVMRR